MAKLEDVPASGQQYSIVQTIAISSRSIVRQARRHSDGALVALKSFVQADSTARQRRELELELAVLKRVHTAGVVRAYEICDLDGQAALVLEDFGGKSLQVPAEGLGVAACLRVATQAARILGAVHDEGIVHNDVKPSNLLIHPQTGELRLIDFHLASGAGLDAARAGEEPQLEGSLPYLSPERTGRMNRRPDYRADFYSLGVTLFEMASGKLPFEASDALGWSHAHLSKRAPALTELNPAIPRPFADIVAKLLAKDPDERYQSSYGLAFDLELCKRAWEEQGAIQPFPLGRRDVSPEFDVSRELVGRDAEIARYLELLTHVTAGGTRFLVLSGAAGAGKSALLDGIGRAALERGAFFLSGTFDERDRTVPYAALVRALGGLVAELLAQPEARLSGWRDALLGALGANASVMTDLVPDLVRVLGQQPALAVLSPTQTHHRLQHVLREFIKVFATEEHPLVLALDDCHWIDASSADALAALLAGADVHYLLVVTAFRSEDVRDDHPLEKLRESPSLQERPLEITLKPLELDAVNRLIASSLSASTEDVEPLARLVREKTEGNPSFLVELLGDLRRQGILWFDGESACWRWDLERARRVQVSDNVAAMTAERIGRLPPEVLNVLSAAACLGNHFELDALAHAVGLAPEGTASLLWEPLSQRLIQPAEAFAEKQAERAPEAFIASEYAFRHARVREAAYARLAASERELLHHRIGRRALQQTSEAELRDRFFDTLHHLNLGRALERDPAARRELAELNLKATARARETAAFKAAESHAAVAVELAGEGAGALGGDLGFRARFALAEAAYLSGDPDLSEALCPRLFELAPDTLARASVHVLLARVLEHKGLLVQTVAEIRAGLALFGVRLPEDPDAIGAAIGEGIARMQAHLARVEVESLAALPGTDSAEVEMTLNLLLQVVPSAIQTYPPLFVLVELTMFDLALTRGVTAVSCKNLVDCGILQAAILGNHDVAYRLGKVAFELLERFPPTPLESAVQFVFGAFVSHWKAHYREGAAAFDKAEALGIERGDVSHATYALVHRTQRSLLTGKPLSEFRVELEDARAYLMRARAHGVAVGVLPAERAIARLTNPDEELARADADDHAATQAVLDSKNAQWAYSYGQAQTMVSFFLGDRDAAKAWLAFTKEYRMASASLFSVPDDHLFEGLIAAKSFTDAPESERPALLETIAAMLGKLEVWAKACPANFAHKHHLLSAERARITGEPLEAMLGAYRRALESATDFPHLSALVNELEGEAWFARGDSRHARANVETAYRLYSEWGATAKTRRLERKYPGWLTSARRDSRRVLPAHGETTTRAATALDAGSIVKATQSISSEVEAPKLFAALMATLIENAGAQRGCLILREETERRYYVEARANVESGDAGHTQRQVLDDAADVCASAVRYVLRTREPLTLDDACAGGAFKADAYVQAQRVRSLLCAPILHQGKVLGVLYLENNRTSRAFTSERLAILQVIASQAAISINNARLYASLEERVRERTQELARKNREVASMLDNMDQGVFTIDDELRVQPGYSRRLEQILGTGAIAGQNCLELLFGGADLRPDALSAADAALRFSFGVPDWLARANSAHLIKEFQKRAPDGESRTFEVDWNLILDDTECVERILVVIRDVTLMRSLKQTAHEKAREADIVTEILECGLDPFRQFCAVARELLDQNRVLLSSGTRLSSTQLTTTFRALHTLKGNARLHGFTHVVDVLHAAEEACVGLRVGGDGPSDANALCAALNSVSELVQQYEDTCQRKLGPLAQNGDHRSDRVLREIAGLVSGADAAEGRSPLAQSLRAVLARLEGVTLADLVRETSRIVPSLAVELGKATPDVRADDAGLVLASDWAQPLRDILIQCFRNALYHGLETPGERELAGKSAASSIAIRTEYITSGVELLFFDDGRGLALESLRQLPGASDSPDEALAERIFETGVTTAREVGHVAGRGVGLDLSRALLRERGGEIGVRFTGPERMGFRPFMFLIRLPSSAVLGPVSDRSSAGPITAARVAKPLQ